MLDLGIELRHTASASGGVAADAEGERAKTGHAPHDHLGGGAGR
ncbi:hypothetical protein AB0E04_46010 [Streptomyces sp. NPDC048251]